VDWNPPKNPTGIAPSEPGAVGSAPENREFAPAIFVVGSLSRPRPSTVHPAGNGAGQIEVDARTMLIATPSPTVPAIVMLVGVALGSWFSKIVSKRICLLLLMIISAVVDATLTWLNVAECGPPLTSPISIPVAQPSIQTCENQNNFDDRSMWIACLVVPVPGGETIVVLSTGSPAAKSVPAGLRRRRASSWTRLRS